MTIRTGIGGWSYDGWRDGVFYPETLPRKDELHYASRHVGAIEINGTYYRLQRPDTFAAWRGATPDGFVFAVKGSRYICSRKVLAEADAAVGKFVAQGLTELGDRLGPVLWQLPAYRAFDPADLDAFFDLLPRKHDGLVLRHVIEVQHDSFCCEEFVELARSHAIGIAYVDAPDQPAIGDLSGGIGYMRLKNARSDCDAGYSASALQGFHRVAEDWARGVVPDGLNRLTSGCAGPADDVFVFFINGAKERAPAAARAFAALL